MCQTEITESMTSVEMLQVLLHNANTLTEQIENVDILRDIEETFGMGKGLYAIKSLAQAISLGVRGMLSEAMERKNAR